MRSTRFLLAAAVLTAASCLHAQGNAPAKWGDTLNTEIDKAQLSGDLAKMHAASALAARVATAYPTDGLILHYQGYAMYREAVIQSGINGTDPSAQLEQARDILERSLKTRPLAETHALLSSIAGQLIAKDPSRAMELGMASGASMAAATSLGPNNPRVWLLKGQGAIFTPSEYGGGLDAAESQLKRAIDLFAKDAPKPGEPSWGRPEAYAWLGQVYEKGGDKVKAAAMYRLALDVSPNYTFAKMAAAALK